MSAAADGADELDDAVLLEAMLAHERAAAAVPQCSHCASLSYVKRLADAFGVFVCRACEKEHCPLITKTDASSTYLVTDAQLEGLRHLDRPNPRNARWGTMKLYLESEVRALSRARFPDDAALEEEKRRRAVVALERRIKTVRKAKRGPVEILDSLPPYDPKRRRRKRRKGKGEDESEEEGEEEAEEEEHVHEFGEEAVFSEASGDDDTLYARTCKSCGFVNKYEKL